MCVRSARSRADVRAVKLEELAAKIGAWISSPPPAVEKEEKGKASE